MARDRNTRAILSFLGPGVAYLLIFTTFPLVYSVWMSLNTWSRSSLNFEFVGLANFASIAQTTEIPLSIIFTNSWIYTIVALSLELGVGLLLAMFFDLQFKGKNFIRIIVLLPILTTPVVIGLMARFLLNPTFGLVDYILGLIGFPPINWIGDPALALPTVILWDVWEWAPFAFLVLHAGLQNIPQESLDAAKVDGASYFRTIRHISIPLVVPYILIIFLFRFVGTFVTFPLIWSITFGGPYYYSSTFSFIAYEEAWYFQNLGVGTAYSLIQLITIIVFVSVFLRYFGKHLMGD